MDAAAGEAALTTFEQDAWGRKYPAIGQSWRRAWGEVIPFYAFPDDVRQILYTTDEMDKRDLWDRCYSSAAQATSWRSAAHRLQAPPGCPRMPADLRRLRTDLDPRKAAREASGEAQRAAGFAGLQHVRVDRRRALGMRQRYLVPVSGLPAPGGAVGFDLFQRATNCS